MTYLKIKIQLAKPETSQKFQIITDMICITKCAFSGRDSRILFCPMAVGEGDKKHRRETWTTGLWLFPWIQGERILREHGGRPGPASRCCPDLCPGGTPRASKSQSGRVRI
jgi:hypothetical protein